MMLQYHAHWKVEGKSGEWLNLAIDFGRETTASITRLSPPGTVTT